MSIEICSGDLSFWRFVQLSRIFFLLKICSWRFIHWRLKEDLSLFEDLFIEICPFEYFFKRLIFLKIYLGDFSFLKMCSWRFIHSKFKGRRFILSKICSGDFSFWRFRRFFLFEKCFRRFILLKLFLEIYTFKNFVFKIYPFKILGDLSFWKFDFRRFFLFEKHFRRFIIFKFC